MPIEHGGDLFAIAREHGWDWRDVLDFSASINPLGPAPGVRAAICQAVERISHYPEREPVRLSSALSQQWNLDEEQILLGNGATELIFFAARAFAADAITLALPVFSEFHRAFPQANFADLNNADTWPREGLLCLTRPANPTGYTLPLDLLTSHLERTRNPILIDESFLEFAGLPSAGDLIKQYTQLMILRSLTKFYALPGLRIGALIGSPDTVHTWRRQREPWQVNVLAEEAALSAIADTNHAVRSLNFVRREREWMRARINEFPKTQALESAANFLYIRLDYKAASLCGHLLRHKILIRNCAAWPGLSGEAVRLAIRPREENERLLQAWGEFHCA